MSGKSMAPIVPTDLAPVSVGSHSARPSAPAVKGLGFAERLIRLFTRSASVSTVQILAPAFFLIRLEGEDLKHIAWRPGQAMQIIFGATTARAYTPIWWDSEQGVLDIMVYSHGAAPGSDWASAAKPGDCCQIVGPRKSLDLTNLPRPAILLGDETSFALAASLRHSHQQWQGVEFMFEVNSVADAKQALLALGLPPTTLIQRSAGDSHLAHMEAQLYARLGLRKDPMLISTGKASSIQAIAKGLKQRGFNAARLRNRAYWATGKKGMD